MPAIITLFIEYLIIYYLIIIYDLVPAAVACSWHPAPALFFIFSLFII
jgi:hypothetical protein